MANGVKEPRKPTLRLTVIMSNRLKRWLLEEHEDWLSVDKTHLYLGPTHKEVAVKMTAKFGEAFTNHHVNAVMGVIADEMGKKYYQRPHSPNGSKKQKEAGPRVTIGALEAFKDAIGGLACRIAELEVRLAKYEVTQQATDALMRSVTAKWPSLGQTPPK